MGARTGIEWTDATWNPIIGCSRVSEGCRNCYAEGIAGRFGQGKKTVYSGLTQIVNGRAVWTGQIVETRQLLAPLSWRQPKRVFVNSMSDLFHENVSDEQRDRIFAVMAICLQHTFQVLTKRPERMLGYIESRRRSNPESMGGAMAAAIAGLRGGRFEWPKGFRWPLPNVWLGVSVENQAAADERIPLLLKTPAPVRFISAEPLLGPVDLTCGFRVRENVKQDALYGSEGLRWIICGGESGPHARPMNPEWARSLRDQCVAVGVPFFFKQWGEWAPLGSADEADNYDPRVLMTSDHRHVRLGKKAAGAHLDGREWKEFPRA